MATMAAMPADADARTRLPMGRYVSAHGIQDADHLVSRNARQFEPGECTHPGKGIAVADTTGLDSDPNLARPRDRGLAMNQLERAIGRRNLNRSHLWHRRLLDLSAPDLRDEHCLAGSMNLGYGGQLRTA